LIVFHTPFPYPMPSTHSNDGAFYHEQPRPSVNLPSLADFSMTSQKLFYNNKQL